MRCSCYEIGGDVFSLAEIESMVLRGNMSRAENPKVPFVVAPKESRAHIYYALEAADARINFVLVRTPHNIFCCCCLPLERNVASYAPAAN